MVEHWRLKGKERSKMETIVWWSAGVGKCKSRSKMETIVGWSRRG